MRRGLLALLAVLAGLLLSATAVYAGINTIPPKMVVKWGGQTIQTGRVHAHSWYFYNGHEYVYSDSKAPEFKYPPVAKAGSVKISLVFRFPYKPYRVYVRTPDGDFLGHSQFYPVKNENGKVVGWGTYFYRNGNHRYIVNAKWAEAEGQSYGTAVYTAHVTNH